MGLVTWFSINVSLKAQGVDKFYNASSWAFERVIAAFSFTPLVMQLDLLHLSTNFTSFAEAFKDSIIGGSKVFTFIKDLLKNNIWTSLLLLLLNIKTVVKPITTILKGTYNTTSKIINKDSETKKKKKKKHLKKSQTLLLTSSEGLTRRNIYKSNISRIIEEEQKSNNEDDEEEDDYDPNVEEIYEEQQNSKERNVFDRIIKIKNIIDIFFQRGIDVINNALSKIPGGPIKFLSLSNVYSSMWSSFFFGMWSVAIPVIFRFAIQVVVPGIWFMIKKLLKFLFSSETNNNKSQEQENENEKIDKVIHDIVNEILNEPYKHDIKHIMFLCTKEILLNMRLDSSNKITLLIEQLNKRNEIKSSFKDHRFGNYTLYANFDKDNSTLNTNIDKVIQMNENSSWIKRFMAPYPEEGVSTTEKAGNVINISSTSMNYVFTSLAYFNIRFIDMMNELVLENSENESGNDTTTT